MVARKPLLPADYQQVEYIEATGTQYINANTPGLNGDTLKIEMDYMSLKQSGESYNVLFGVKKDNNPFYGAYVSILSALTIAYVFGGGDSSLQPEQGSGNAISGTNIAYGNRNIYALSRNSFTVKGDNDYSYVPGTNAFPSTIASLYLMARNNISGVSGDAHGRCYSAKIWSGDNLTRDFVPCYRKSDSVVGLYDLVSGSFFTNAGTGAFTKGGNV